MAGSSRFPTPAITTLPTASPAIRPARTKICGSASCARTRDEVDAIEAFGTFLWDIRFKDFQAEYDLARITWDEARHTEIGQSAQAAG